MLNEIKELEEYTCPLDDIHPCRLKWGNIKNFSSVPRALSVIARYAYYDCKMGPDEINYILRLWCGFEKDPGKIDLEKIDKEDRERVSNLCGWLPSYISGLKPQKSRESDHEIDETRNTILVELEKKSKVWTRNIFQSSGEKNDINAIYLDGIIADAVDKGPLKTRYLVFKKDPADGACGISCKNKTQMGKFHDQWLKVIAAVLMGQIEGSEYSDVDYGSIANWMHTGAAEGKKVGGVIKKIKYNFWEKQDYEIISVINVNDSIGKYLRIDPDWLEEYGAKIVDKAEGVYYLEGFVYEDEGCTGGLCRQRR